MISRGLAGDWAGYVIEDAFAVDGDGKGGGGSAVRVGIGILLKEVMYPCETGIEGFCFWSFGVVVGVGGWGWKESAASDVRVDGVIGGGNNPGVGGRVIFD